MAAYHAWGWALAGRSFGYNSRARDSRCATALGLSVNLKGTAIPGKQNGWSPHPIPKEDLGLTPLEARSVGVPCIASTDGGVQETAGPHALFCKPGDVDSLVDVHEKAIQMEDSQYQELSRLAKVDLEQYVRPLDEYAMEYLSLIHNR